MNTALLEKITSTQDFATLPQVVMKVLDMLRDDQSLDFKELSKLIETDASLTIKLIRVANSPLFAIGSSINSVHQAILTLGLNRVSNIVMGISIFSKFMYSSNPKLQILMKKYWKHTSAVGVVAKSLTKRVGANFKDVEFIGGLLHDIGKMAMMQFDNLEMYLNVAYMVETKQQNEYEAERRVFDMDHCDVGYEIARRWKLPSTLTSIIANHRDFTKAKKDDQTVVAIVNMSNLLCDIWGNGFFEGINNIQFEELPEWQHICSVSSNKDLDIAEITFALEKDYLEAEQFINMIGK
jgi:putative nucleotidyltransferase with HDIG domain